MSDRVDTYDPLIHEVHATARMGANPSGSWVKVSDYDAAVRRAEEAEKELAECRNSRQREHDLRVTIAGELESFKIRYQDEVNAHTLATYPYPPYISVSRNDDMKSVLITVRTSFIELSNAEYDKLVLDMKSEICDGITYSGASEHG